MILNVLFGFEMVYDGGICFLKSSPKWKNWLCARLWKVFASTINIMFSFFSKLDKLLKIICTLYKFICLPVKNSTIFCSVTFRAVQSSFCRIKMSELVLLLNLRIFENVTFRKSWCKYGILSHDNGSLPNLDGADTKRNMNFDFLLAKSDIGFDQELNKLENEEERLSACKTGSKVVFFDWFQSIVQ